MAKPLLPDGLWEIVQPLLPEEPPKPRGGRPRVPDRQALTGILFVLRSGLPWSMMPKELGCGSGVTCWRRLRDWQAAGVWEAVFHHVLDWRRAEDRLDLDRVVVDSSSVRALSGGHRRAPTPQIAAERARSTTC